MRKHPRNDAVYPAVEIARHVFQRLAAAYGSITEHRISAQLFDGKLEGEPRAQRRLLKQQRNRFSRQRLSKPSWRALHFQRQIEQIREFIVRQIEIAPEIPRVGLDDLALD